MAAFSTGPSASAQTGTSDPRFINSVVNQSVLAGQSATFVANATGTANLSYQWQRLIVGSTVWENITFGLEVIYSGANSSTMVVNYISVGMSGEQFRCVITNGIGNTAVSNVATLAVTQSNQAPSIITQPASQTVTTGFETLFTVVASGSPSPTFQWYRGSNAIAGATTSTFRIVNAQIADSGSYSVEISNSGGTVTSNVITLTVVPVVASVGFYPLTTIAGQPNVFGALNAIGTAARFYSPSGVAVDPSGNLYIADQDNHLIRKITSTGTVSTVAGLSGNGGSNDGPVTQARFLYPKSLAVDTAGNVFVADTFNHTIRKVSVLGVVSTLAGQAGSTGALDGAGTAARFNFPQGIAIDASGNLFVADRDSHTIRKITPAGVVSTLAGLAGTPGSADGAGAAARFFGPFGVAVGPQGDVYVADRYNNTIRKITPAGVVTTVAGAAGVNGSADGAGLNARFSIPNGVAADSAGNLYIADGSNSTLRKVNTAGFVSTISGVAFQKGFIDGTGVDARLNTPTGIAVSEGGDLFVTDLVTHTVRKATLMSLPQLTDQPKDKLVVAGIPATFSTGAIGTSPLSFQWQRLSAGQFNWINLLSGQGVTGANSPTLLVTSPTTAMSGDQFRCAIANGFGLELSDVATLSVTPLILPPAIATQPVNQSVTFGRDARFEISVTGTSPLSYRWFMQAADSTWIDLTTDLSQKYTGASTSVLTVTSVTSLQQGSRYRCVITNAAGSATSDSVVLTVTVVPSQLSNISVLASAGSGAKTLIIGFVSAGSTSKQLVLRVVGPELTNFGVTGALDDPRMFLYSAGPDMLLGQNDDWGGGASLVTAMQQVGAFPLPGASKDAALLATVPPGGYSVHGSAKGDATGSVLIEAYDADSPTIDSRLSNLSARSFIGAGNNGILILGFTVRGDTPKTLLIRSAGPALFDFGVTDALLDPKIKLISETNVTLAENDNWGGTSALSEAFTRTGAFGFTPNSRDAALLVTVSPGRYSIHISGVSDTTGVVLAEVYEVQ